MQLNELQDVIPMKRGKRVGRGIGSGKGKTCGVGVKGQKARSGVAIKGFEGGQMPLHIRLPKRGFFNHFRVEYQPVRLDKLLLLVRAGSFAKDAVIDSDLLLAAGLVRSTQKPIKLLGGRAALDEGDVLAIKVVVDAVSASAKTAVEKAGGSVTLTQDQAA
jgi:large subunit ribosomal protein L15